MVTLTFVGLILLFFLVDLLVVRKLERPPEEHGHGTEAQGFPLKSEILLPPDYYFHPGHAWALETGAGKIAIGIGDLVQAAAGPLTRIELPAVGDTIEAGQKAFSLVIGGHELNLVAPLGGKVLSVNTDLKRSPDLVNTDPYGSGWLLEIDPGGGKEALKELMIGDAAKEWMEQEVNKAGEFVARYRKATSITHMLIGANKQVWNMFESAFLSGAREEV